MTRKENLECGFRAGVNTLQIGSGFTGVGVFHLHFTDVIDSRGDILGEPATIIFIGYILKIGSSINIYSAAELIGADIYG